MKQEHSTFAFYCLNKRLTPLDLQPFQTCRTLCTLLLEQDAIWKRWCCVLSDHQQEEESGDKLESKSFYKERFRRLHPPIHFIVDVQHKLPVLLNYWSWHIKTVDDAVGTVLNPKVDAGPLVNRVS
jgi:hypothetical protein